VSPPRIGLCLLAMGGAACSGAPSATTDGGTFVAFASDFKGFHDWPNQAEATPASTLPPFDAGVLAADGGLHPVPQHEYWNMNPPSGSTTFPVGFMVVKETAARWRWSSGAAPSPFWGRAAGSFTT
jgi:hypothetical protein